MNDGLDTPVLQRVDDERRVDEIAFDEQRRGRDGVAIAAREIVEDRHVVPAIDEHVGHHAADVSCSTSDEDAHRCRSLNESCYDARCTRPLLRRIDYIGRF